MARIGKHRMETRKSFYCKYTRLRQAWWVTVNFSGNGIVSIIVVLGKILLLILIFTYLEGSDTIFNFVTFSVWIQYFLCNFQGIRQLYEIFWKQNNILQWGYFYSIIQHKTNRNVTYRIFQYNLSFSIVNKKRNLIYPPDLSQM